MFYDIFNYEISCQLLQANTNPYLSITWLTNWKNTCVTNGNKDIHLPSFYILTGNCLTARLCLSRTQLFFRFLPAHIPTQTFHHLLRNRRGLIGGCSYSHSDSSMMCNGEKWPPKKFKTFVFLYPLLSLSDERKDENRWLWNSIKSSFQIAPKKFMRFLK